MKIKTKISAHLPASNLRKSACHTSRQLADTSSRVAQPTTRKKRVQKLSHNLQVKLVPVLVKLFKTCKGKTKSVNQYWIKTYLSTHTGVDVPTRVTRKLIHYIRVNGLVPNLIAYNKGYYIARTNSEAKTYLARVSSHIKELQQIKTAITKQSKKLK